jgi:hypothetical protein
MKRLVLSCGLMIFLVTPAMAIEEFHRQWKDHYLSDDNVDEKLKELGKSGCHICHVKGVKKDVRNEYGVALEKYLSAEDFPADWVAANPEEAKKRIVAAFKQVEEDLKRSAGSNRDIRAE